MGVKSAEQEAVNTTPRQDCNELTGWIPSQGVRPAALQKVHSQELAEFISVCIRARNERPRARQLLKAPYFDSIREKCTVRCDALLSPATSLVSSQPKGG